MASGYEPDEELSELITKLWDMDVNRCESGIEYDIDKQGYVKNAREMSEVDRAWYNLFRWVAEDDVFSRPTYNAFRKLLDNYESETGRGEVITEEEEAENWEFLDAILETDLMKEAHQYLVGLEQSPEDPDEFRQQLYDIWFKLYKRSREDEENDSSSFEHVFVGETRGHRVIGFHNWVQLYLQEKHGNIDYKGYFRRGTVSEEEGEDPRLLTLQFSWKNGQGKPIGSSFIGTSPEFELALYTIVFLSGKGSRVPIKIGDLFNIELHCYPHDMGIGTAYPVAKW
ncbi:unnamed protein product [Owenia fusiformis]|uniref:Uridylate-specific endoribonuclease n=1 Tax=Owenia fusiformis TaxID=6347 RepID=A0A8J1UC10_OWEFU|nr:unnamed protein product [Owenia fusiformis]